MNHFWLTTFGLFYIFFASTWVLFGHKVVLGDETKDQSHDPLFSKLLMNLSFGFILLLEVSFSLRRLGLPIGVELLEVPKTGASLLLGLTIFSVGLFLRIWAVSTLGRLFTFEIGIRDNHTLIQAGPYRWIRHPSYTGFVFIILGAGIAYSSLLFLVLLLPAALGFFLYRILSEEKMLKSRFGTEYESYMKKTKRLLPYIFM